MDERKDAHPARSVWYGYFTWGRRLVDRRCCGMPQPLDLILDHQLSSLQLGNLQVVCGKVHERFVQFMFEYLVLTFQLNKMRLYCHTKSPRWVKPQIRSGRGSLHHSPNLSMGIRKSRLIFELSVTNRDLWNRLGLQSPPARTIFTATATAAPFTTSSCFLVNAHHD